MRRPRVCIYGGTDLEGPQTRFISDLAYAILDRLDWVIVTGGFDHQGRKAGAVSTDMAALEGARRYAADHARDLRDCYCAWVPEPTLDRRPDVGGVVRMTEALGISVIRATGRTALGRRLAMVRGVDVVVTISGSRHTEVVGEQAIELGMPFLPIPSAGGDSEKLLRDYRERIAARFDPGALDACLEHLEGTLAQRPGLAAEAVVALLGTAKVGRCLVLLPYDGEHQALYEAVIKPAVDAHMIPIRLDQLPKSDAIYTSFANAMEDATAVIVDITRLNENVMYEVGFAHARGMSPLIYTRDPARIEQLPVYFRTLNVRLVTWETPLPRLIGQYLEQAREQAPSR